MARTAQDASTPALSNLSRVPSPTGSDTCAKMTGIVRVVVDSLACPGGNITGFQNFETAIGDGKWLQLLKEIAPDLIVVWSNPACGGVEAGAAVVSAKREYFRIEPETFMFKNVLSRIALVPLAASTRRFAITTLLKSIDFDMAIPSQGTTALIVPCWNVDAFHALKREGRP